MISFLLDLCELLKDNPSAVNIGLGIGMLIGSILGLAIMKKLWAHKPMTMNEKYGDGSNHIVCEDCGFCITCGDCAQYGCKIGEWPWPTANSQTH